MKSSVTGSIYPKRKHIRLSPDAYGKPATWYFVTICCRNKEPRLEAPALRDLVQGILRRTATRQRAELAAYSILPNHLHMVSSAGRKGLIAFVQEFKSCAAVEVMRRGGRSPCQASFFDHKIRSEESLQQKCTYVWLNPVRLGLARRPEDYPWNGRLLFG